MGEPDLSAWDDVELDLSGWDDVEFDPALFECPDWDVSNWLPDPEPPPPKPLHKMHWRRRLAMLKAIGNEYSQTPTGAPSDAPE
jgi:hypothetical protein